eukprot:1678861-Rhodomonas_salina.1
MFTFRAQAITPKRHNLGNRWNPGDLDWATADNIRRMISGSVGSRVSLTVRQHEDGLFGLQGGRPVTVDLVRIASDKLIAGHQLYDKLGTLLRMTAGHENGTEDFVNKLAVGVTGAPASPRPGTPRGSTHSSSGAINGEVRNGLEESRNLLRTLLRAVFSEERGVDDGMLREKQRVRSLTNRLKQTLSDRPRSLGPRSGVQRDAQVDREREEERLRMEEEQLRMVQTIQELSNRVGELNLQLQTTLTEALDRTRKCSCSSWSKRSSLTRTARRLSKSRSQLLARCAPHTLALILAERMAAPGGAAPLACAAAAAQRCGRRGRGDAGAGAAAGQRALASTLPARASTTSTVADADAGVCGAARRGWRSPPQSTASRAHSRPAPVSHPRARFRLPFPH